MYLFRHYKIATIDMYVMEVFAENKRYYHNFKCAVINPQADLEQEVHTAEVI